MNVNLGAPYEAAIKSIIEKGYAGSQTEVIQMKDIEAKKSKTYYFDDIKKIVKR
ncbi:MAG: hypothetical protein WA137_13045 [Methanothrix sp.]